MLQRNAGLSRVKPTNDSLPWLTPRHISSTPCPSCLPPGCPPHTVGMSIPLATGSQTSCSPGSAGEPRTWSQRANTKPKSPFTSSSRCWGLSRLFLHWLWATTQAIWRVTQRDTLRLKVERATLSGERRQRLWSTSQLKMKPATSARMRWLDGITDSHHNFWANSSRWWRTGKPGVLQSTGSQRVGHDWATEQHHHSDAH